MSLPPFEEVVAENGEVVLRVCRAILGTQDAEDAWSETFLSALAAYPGIDQDSDLRAWLVTIAHHKAIDRTRARTASPLSLDEAAEPPAATRPEEKRDLDLWNSVAKLPTRQREAVAYHYLAGLPYARVAELIGGTQEAARRAAADGIANLRSSADWRDQP